MEKTARKLEEYRRQKTEKLERQMVNEEEEAKLIEPELLAEPRTNKSVAWIGNFWQTEQLSENEDSSDPIISKKLALVLFVIGQGLSIWVEFGLVFLIFSLIVFTYLNTGRRQKGELSAYSVFNEKCERLPGQMTAEHFERDMLRQRRN